MEYEEMGKSESETEVEYLLSSKGHKRLVTRESTSPPV